MGDGSNSSKAKLL